MGIRDSFPRDEVDHSPPSNAESECVELYFHSPNTPSWRGAQLKQKNVSIILEYKTFLLYFAEYTAYQMKVVHLNVIHITY